MTADATENGACKALWLALIERMILDACGIGCTELEQSQARVWLFRPNPGFSEACALADLEPSYVRTRARQRVDASAQRIDLRADQPAKDKRMKRTGAIAVINGRTMRLVDWIKESPVTKQTVYYRIRRGWTIEEALFTPATINGKSPGVGLAPAKSGPDRSFPTAQDTL